VIYRFNRQFSFFSSIFLKAFILFPALAAAEPLDDLRSMVDGLLDQNFRVREVTTIILNGSEAASSIQRTSHITNEVVYTKDSGWRVRRQSPITEVIREYRKTNKDKDEHLQVMTPTNRGIEPREAMTDAIWLEILASPLRLAQQWSLAAGDTNLARWLENIRSLKGPLKNAEGDEMTVEVGADKSLKINFKGSILHEGKTRVGIESTWMLMDISKITDTDLNQSLMRSS
jgi:hypothetical protein